MGRVLIHKGKYETTYYDASTPDKEAGAFLDIFRALDDFGVYWYANEDEKPKRPTKPEGHVEGCLCEDCKDLPAKIRGFENDLAEWDEMRGLYKAAKQGDARAARRLVTARKDYEYEQVTNEKLEVFVDHYAKDPDEFGTPKNPCNVYTLLDCGDYGVRFGIHHGVVFKDVAVYADKQKMLKQFRTERRMYVELPEGERDRYLRESYVVEGKAIAYDEPDVELLDSLKPGTRLVPKKVYVFANTICTTHERDRDRFKD